MSPLAQNPPSKFLKNVFFILNYSKPLFIKGFNSSLALSAAELWLAKVWPENANYAFSEI